MRKTILTMVALAAFSVTGLSAQGSVNAGGKVQGSAVFTENDQALDFGTMTPSGETAARTVDLYTTTADADGAQAGWVEVRLNRSGTTLTFTMTDLEAHVGEATAVLPATYACGVRVGTSAVAITHPTVAGDFVATSSDCENVALSVGSLGVSAKMVRAYLGGTISATDLDAALAETYSGTITVTAGSYTF